DTLTYEFSQVRFGLNERSRAYKQFVLSFKGCR
ncbi:unnamed protein product, partial [marine sediment metagenome]